MKVTWQADDIKAGVAVCRGYTGAGTEGVIVFQYIHNEGP